MKAWIGTGRGADVRFALGELPTPVVAADELLVGVRAVGINRVDQFPSGAHFQHSAPAGAAVPGIEIAGEVVAAGAGVSGFAGGERVCAMTQAGCAEFAVVKVALAIRIPPAMAWTDAAAIPVSYLTAHNALVTLGGARPGQSLLIHAVSTGVGIAALQLAVLHKIAFIAGSGTSPRKLERLSALGLNLALADPYAGFADRVLQHTDGRGADVVIDNIGAALLNETLRCTVLGGCIVNVGRLGGVEAQIDLNLHALRRIRLLGATFRTRSLQEHAQVVRDFMSDHGAALAKGGLRPLIDSVFPFDDLPGAVRRSVQREQLGKIILETGA